MKLKPEKNIEVTSSDSTAADNNNNNNKKYNDGKWYFVLLTYNGSLLRLDIDGNQISTENTKGAIPDNTGEQPLRIGANSLEKDRYFTRKVDEIRI